MNIHWKVISLETLDSVIKLREECTRELLKSLPVSHIISHAVVKYEGCIKKIMVYNRLGFFGHS